MSDRAEAPGSAGASPAELLEVAVAAARAGGAVLVEGLSRPKQVELKSERSSIVTWADVTPSATIFERHRQSHFPDHAILGEERHRGAAPGRPPSVGSSTTGTWMSIPSTARRTTPTACRSPALGGRPRRRRRGRRARSSSRSGASCSPRLAGAGRGSATSALQTVHAPRVAATRCRALVCTGLQSDEPEARSRPTAAAWSPSTRRSAEDARASARRRCAWPTSQPAASTRFLERDATYAWDVAAGGLMITEAGGRMRRPRRRPAQPRPRPRQRAGHQRSHPRRAGRPDRRHRPRASPERPVAHAARPRRRCQVPLWHNRPLQPRTRHWGMPWPRSCRSISSSSGIRAGSPSCIDEPVGVRSDPCPFTKADEDALLVRRLPLAAWLLAARLPLRHRLPRGRPSSPPTSCRCLRPADSCSGWAGRSSTRARCPSPRRGRSATAPRASRRTCPRSSRTSTPSGTSGSGSSSSGCSYFESYDFAGKSLADLGQYMHRRPHVPAAGLGDPLRDHVPAARRSTSSSTACAPRTASTRATSPRCSRAATPRSWRPTGPCGTSPTRPSASASPTSSTTSPSRSATRWPRPAATPRSG